MEPDHHYFTYILASDRNGTLYTGVTNDLNRRVIEHRSGEGSKFVARYGVTRLVWFEEHSDIEEAILREKRIKRWARAWKLELIEAGNP
ncbi:GIY-YIG nuclease family protein, partial [Rubrivirga sp.]|uniref:GIY-YIG nuclease family protein n=1 Tax=Rubrivirga sp. TaxID=1885344 RepID=UPI003C729FE4